MNFLVLAAIGVFAGITSGLFGVGGGVLFVPLLIIVKKFEPSLAIGTSIAVIIPTACAAAWRHSLSGMVDWKTVLILAVFAITGAWFGAELSLKLNAALLRRLFAVFLFVMSFKLYFQK
jgi:uncharacterized membrane protein YfcA